MLYDFEVDDTFVGQTIGPTDGFLVDNKQVRSASRHVTPAADEGKRYWVSAYFQIRGSEDLRDLICVNPSQAPAWPGYVVNRSIPYLGGLRILCVPVGSLWQMTLSDAPLTQREINERAEALRRRALEDHIIAVRGAKSNARRAKAVMEGATRPV